MADVDLTPTAEMARNAARGLELRREHGRGGTEVGVARARDISNGKTLSPETVRRMHAFFSRHAKNKAGGEDDAGYIAWMLWGGDEGRDWASSKVDALDRKEMNAMSETRKAIMERLGMAAGGEKQVFASSDDIMEMAQMLSAVESAVMHKRIEEAKSLLRKIQPIVERNRGSRELDAQGMVRAYNDYRRKLGMSRPGAKAKMAAQKVARFRVGKDLSGGYSVVPMKADGSVETSVYEEIGFRHSFPTADAALAKAKQMQAKYGGTVTMEDKQVSSRPGAKAKFADDKALASFLKKWRQNEADNNHSENVVMLAKFVGSSAEIAEAKDILRKHDEIGHLPGDLNTKRYSLYKTLKAKLLAKYPGATFSRPGAKVKMDKNAAYIEYANLRETTSKLENRIARAPASDKPRLMAELAKQVQRMKELSQILRASRPGAKAKMQKEYVLWGIPKGKTSALDEQVLSTQAKTPAQMDAIKKRAAADGWHSFRVQILDLSKPYKGFDFSRPGAKAAMAADAGMVARAIAEHNRQRRAYQEAKERLEALVRLGHSEQRIEQAERGVQLAEERMNEAAKALKNLNTRPGAKVRAALADACWEGYEAVGTKPQDGKTVPNCVPKMKASRAEDLYRKLSGGTITNANVREWDRLVTEALRMPDFTPPGGDMSLHEIAEELGGEIMALKSRAAKAQAAKPAEGDLEREDVKAGLKLMSASDPAVSDKIRTLIKEGKPQDQAVAIALDMKRRGEL